MNAQLRHPPDGRFAPAGDAGRMARTLRAAPSGAADWHQPPPLGRQTLAGRPVIESRA